MGSRISRGTVRHGFGLLEVLLGMFIFAMASLAIVSSLIFSHRVNSQNTIRTAAVSAARYQMEKLQTKRASNRRVVSNANFRIPQDILDQFPSGSTELNVQGTYSVADYANGAQLLTVTVSWRSAMTRGDRSAAPVSSVVLSGVVSY